MASPAPSHGRSSDRVLPRPDLGLRLEQRDDTLWVVTTTWDLAVCLTPPGVRVPTGSGSLAPSVRELWQEVRVLLAWRAQYASHAEFLAVWPDTMGGPPAALAERYLVLGTVLDALRVLLGADRVAALLRAED